MVVERMNPFDDEGKIIGICGAEHVYRYMWAVEYLREQDYSGTILDCACGCGYGSKTISSIGQVIGIDKSMEALNTANKLYSTQNTEFIQGDLDNEGLREIITECGVEEFGAVVSFETLEHVVNPRSLLKQFYNVLRPDGYLLCSVPNGAKEEREGGEFINKYHLHSFSLDDITSLFEESGFVIDRVYGQSVFKIPLMWYRKIRQGISEKYLERCFAETELPAKEEWSTRFKVLMWGIDRICDNEHLAEAFFKPNNLLLSWAPNIVIAARKKQES
jgi:SAM-dependent methyltransferase